MSKQLKMTLSLGFLMLGQGALAANATATLTVQTTVQSACSLTDATLTFPNYSATLGASGTATTNINCSLLTPYTLSFDNGANYGSGSRRMKQTINTTDYFIPYTLTPVSAGVGVGVGVAIPTSIAGTAAAQPLAPTGDYSDTVVMTLAF